MIFRFPWDRFIVSTGAKAFLYLPVTSTQSATLVYAFESHKTLISPSFGGWEGLETAISYIGLTLRGKSAPPPFEILATPPHAHK